MKREIRATGDCPVIVRKEGEPTKIVGYAARFNELSSQLGFFKEKIAPGAFAAVVEENDVRALFNHNEDHVLGRTSAGTLKLYEDEFGLRYEILADTEQTFVSDLLKRIERGDVRESSFGFILGDDEWNDEASPPVRTILSVSRLFDVGPVTFPAYPTATANVRSAREVFEERSKPVATDSKEGESDTDTAPPEDEGGKTSTDANAMRKRRMEIAERF